MPLDIKKQLKQLYSAPEQAPVIVEVPELEFLMIDGAGDPRSAQAYQDAVSALYGLAYGLKFALKKRDPAADYAVAPLEGQWWTEDVAAFSYDDRSNWRWCMMICQPVAPPPELLAALAEDVARKKGLPAARQVRLARLHEGLAAQIMHVGPYAAEPPTIARLHEFIGAQGYRLVGKHHEIYLGDPSRTAPEKLRTIIRQPIAPS